MITLFCDNACDLWKDQIVSWNVKVLNFDYIIDNVLQKDTSDTPEELDEFYQKLKNGAVATTKPISERRILKAFEDEVKEGNDVLFIHISNQLTTSYNCLPKVIDKLKVKPKDSEKIILDDFSLKIKDGEIHAIMGPNGVGKSTLSKVIMGSNHYDVIAGSIKYNDKELTTLTTDEIARCGIYIVMQEAPVIEEFFLIVMDLLLSAYL